MPVGFFFLSVMLFGYFGPWIGQRAAVLAWNPYDLFDILRFLPAIESGTLRPNLQMLRFPLLSAGVLLPLIAGRHTWLRWMVAVVGIFLAVNTLPPYPTILTAAQTPGWDVVLAWGVGTMGVIVLAALVTPYLGRWRWLLVILLTGFAVIPSLLTFSQLFPAVAALYKTPVNPGWGLWVFVSGALGLTVWYVEEGIYGWRRGVEESGRAGTTGFSGSVAGGEGSL